MLREENIAIEIKSQGYSCQQEGAERLVGVCIEEWVKVNLTSMYNEMEGAGAIALPLSIKNGMLTIKKGLDK